MILLEEKLYTSEETASILGISLRTLYRYLKKGEIEAETKTQSGTFRFTRKQIYKYLYPDKYSLILEKLKLNDSGSSALTYVDDNDFKNLPKAPPQNSINTSSNDSYVPAIPEVKVAIKPEPSVNKLPESQPETLNISKPVSEAEATKIIEQRENKDLDSELSNLESLLSSPTPGITSSPQITTPSAGTVITPQPVVNESSQVSNLNNSQVANTPDILSTPQTTINAPVSPKIPESGEVWKYFVNVSKDILDLAREMNSISSETGRKYAATMRGGLSLHHDIDEFNLVHFYVLTEDLNWYAEQLELKPCEEKEANICLISTTDQQIFDSSYKLRGLTVVSDSRLIQDLMSHNEKELAKTLL